jgi:hypothetical protein
MFGLTGWGHLTLDRQNTGTHMDRRSNLAVEGLA